MYHYKSLKKPAWSPFPIDFIKMFVPGITTHDDMLQLITPAFPLSIIR